MNKGEKINMLYECQIYPNCNGVKPCTFDENAEDFIKMARNTRCNVSVDKIKEKIKKVTFTG
jgi:hypothetical protein